MVKIDFAKAERDFAKAMRQYAELSKKEVSEALNKKAKDVAIRAIKYTPKADKERIEQQLRANGLVYKLVKKTGLTKKQIQQKAERMIRARKRSAGYIKAGWYKAAQVFGARGGRTKAKGLAAQGTASKATPSKTEAVMNNYTKGATKVSGQALARSMDEVRKDMMVYIGRKLREKWGKR
jgi:hypothetical protein